MTYKQKFQDLLDYCTNIGITVVLLFSDELRDYAAIHSDIGNILGFTVDGQRMPDNTIYLDGNFSRGGRNKVRYLTLKHEIIEMDLMRKGISYWDAHCQALIAEQNDDFPDNKML